MVDGAAGKGPQLRKGANLSLYNQNFPDIDWHRCCAECAYCEPPVCTHEMNPPMEVTGDYVCKYFWRRHGAKTSINSEGVGPSANPGKGQD